MRGHLKIYTFVNYKNPHDAKTIKGNIHECTIRGDK